MPTRNFFPIQLGKKCLFFPPSEARWFPFSGRFVEEEESRSDSPLGGEAPLPSREATLTLFGVGYPSVRQFALINLPQTFTDLDETWQE